MKKIVLALFSMLFVSAAAHSASLYILYDPACMDRLEYVALNGNDKSEYIVYHVNTSPGVKMVLEVGAESTTSSQDFQPAQVIRCNNSVFDEKLVNAINSNIDRVFMVVKKGNNRYFISPIAFAARYLRANDYILYDSPKYRFQFDTQMGTIGENIAYKNPNTKVFFEGMLDNKCSGTLLFRQEAEFAGNPHTNIELIPEIGIVEERSGINAADAMRNILRLEKVNGKKLDRYMLQLCQGIEEPESIEAAAQPVQPAEEFLTTGPRVGATAAKGETPAPESPNLPAAAPAADEFHTVKKGETLYRLSKKYNVSVEQIRAWNNKGNSNTILAGEKLRVSPPAAQQSAPREGQARALGGPLGYENTSPSPTPQAQPTGTYARGTGGGQSNNYHVVKPGETIASIAMRYGYTEGRFRQFNNLGQNDVAVIGMALKTSDCDCPPPQPAPAASTAPALAQPEEAPESYNTTGPQIRTRYYQPGFVQRPAGSTTSRSAADPARSPEESFYEDDLNPNRSSGGKEYEYLNTPLFLDRPTASPPATTAPPPARQVAPPASSSSTQGREYSAEGDFYSITGSRVGANAGSGGGAPSAGAGRSSTGLISGSISSRSPVGGGVVQGYGTTTPQREVSARDRSFYVVKEGDTLYRIARMYGMTVERLREINNLGPGEVIIPYQKIYLN